MVNVKRILYGLAGIMLASTQAYNPCYEIAYKGVPLRELKRQDTENLRTYKQTVKAKIEEVIAALQHPETFSSTEAQRFISEITRMASVLRLTLDGVEGLHYGRLEEDQEKYDEKHIISYWIDYDESGDYDSWTLSHPNSEIYPKFDYFYYATDSEKEGLEELIPQLTDLLKQITDKQ